MSFQLNQTESVISTQAMLNMSEHYLLFILIQLRSGRSRIYSLLNNLANQIANKPIKLWVLFNGLATYSCFCEIDNWSVNDG